jgi:cytochrome P450 family 9
MIIDRICTKPYEMVNSDGTKVTLNVGDGISIPVAAIHRDPKYWPNPGKFDPERFSEANKDQIVPSAYMPFGAGPRNCIGSRFALMEAKAIFYNILLKFRIEKSTKMAYPIKLNVKSVLFAAEDGIWVKMVARNGN